jgi:PAS domain S-box-containing protein
VREPPIPADEARRLATLRSLGILDTPPEERFDRITRLAAALFDVPMAVVSLVDANRQWFKSCVGMDDTETDRRVSFCAHALESDAALVIEDATADVRFAGNPLVTGEDDTIRFYAGHPLRPEEGSAVGTLCVIDRSPRHFAERERQLLADLASLVEEELSTVDLARTTSALAASEERLSGILASVAEAVATFSIEGEVLSLNPPGERMFGRTEADVVGTPITSLIAPDDHALVLELLADRAAADVGEQVNVSIRGVRADGRAFPMEVSVNELVRSAGTAFIAVARDVSEVDALRRRTQLIIDAAGDAICGVDRDGLVVFANPAAARVLGVDDAAALRGVDMHGAFHHTRPDGSRYPWESCPTYRTIAEGAGRAVERELFWRIDGTPFDVEYTAEPLVEGGEVTGAVIVFSDISARVEVERFKDQFVSIVSHELRTPLTSIQGSLGLLAGGALGGLDPEQAEMIDVALANTKRLVRLVNDILDLERISSNQLELRLEACDAAAIASEAARAVAGTSETAGVAVDVAVEPRPLVADADRLVQALTNLIGNAVKFSPAGTTVQVTAEHAPSTTTFVVTDRGRGIPAAKLEAIFDRFEQVDVTDRREKGGSGLGLPITRSIARQHGGDVTVSSVLGEGSTFRLTIPVGRG